MVFPGRRLPFTWTSMVLLACTLSPGISRTAAGAEPDPLDCRKRFGELTRRALTSSATDYFKGDRGPAFWVKPFIPLRQAVNSTLRQLHRRTYPIMAFDDGSPIKANYLARSLYNRLDPRETALNLDEIKKDLDFAFSYIKSYPADVAAYVDAESTARMQKLALEDALEQIKNPKQGQGPGFPWLIDLPITQGDKVSTQKKLFDDPTQIKVQIKQLEDSIKKMKGSLTEVGSFENRAYQQALSIKILETYRNELMKQMYKDPKVPIAPEAHALVDQINSVIGLGKGKIPEAYRPPKDAFENIQWVQMRRELKEFSITQAPDLNNSSILSGLRSDPGAVGAIRLPSDSLAGTKPVTPTDLTPGGTPFSDPGLGGGIDIGTGGGATTPAGPVAGERKLNDFGKLVDAIKNLSDEQKEALGLNRLGAYTATLNRGKWVVGASSVFAIATQGPKPWIGYLPDFWANFIASDSMRRRLCAVKDEISFSECVLNYIKEKYPVDYILQMEKGTQTLVVIDPKTKQPVMNKQVQAEFEQLMKLRTEYKSFKAREMDFQAIVSGEIMKKDPTSDRWVQALIATPDKEQFKKGLIAYFEALYPLSFEPFREATISAIDAPQNKQIDLLNKIVSDNFEIGSKFMDIMNKRAYAAAPMGGYYPPLGNTVPLPTGPNSGAGGQNPGPLGSPYFIKGQTGGDTQTEEEKALKKLEGKIRNQWLRQ